jgi:alpha/beta superfamily hydrolase
MKKRFNHAVKINNFELIGVENFNSDAENHTPILILHGHLSSNRIGPNRLYYEMANNLNNIFQRVYRFDLSGMGESEGTLDEVEFKDHCNQVEKLCRYILNQSGKRKLNIIGHCMGANIAISIMNDNVSIINRIALISLYFSNEITFSKIFNEEQWQELNNTGQTIRKWVICKKSFFIGQNSYETIIENINKFPQSYILIYTTDDELIPLGEYDKLSKYLLCKKNIIKKTDHNFLNPGSKNVLFTVLKEYFI